MQDLPFESGEGEASRPWSDVEEFIAHVWWWADRIGVEPATVAVEPSQRNWGCCSSAGALLFDADLLTMERSWGEAVIVHELVHLVVPNHGPLFRALVLTHLSTNTGAATRRIQ